MNSTLLNPMGRKVVYGVAVVVGAVLWTASMWAPEQYVRGTESIGQIVLIIGNLIAFLHTITRTADGMPTPGVEGLEQNPDTFLPPSAVDFSPPPTPVIVVNTSPNDVTATVTTEEIFDQPTEEDVVYGAPWPENWPPPGDTPSPND